MQLKAGTRLESTTCNTQVVVVKAPADDVDVRCGGAPMEDVGTGSDKQPITFEGDATLMGKRYADEELGLELLCTQPGDGALSIGDTALLIKGAKPLPSSD